MILFCMILFDTEREHYRRFSHIATMTHCTMDRIGAFLHTAGMRASIGTLLLAAILLSGCDSPDTPDWMRRPLRAPHDAGELVILTVRGPTTLHDAPGGYAHESDKNFAGYEHDLADLFAKELGVKAVFVVLPSYTKLIEAIEKGRGHLAAAALAQTDDMRARFAFGPSYKSIQYQLIYRGAEERPRTLNAAIGKKIAAVAETPAHDILRDLTGTYPGIILDVLPHETDPDQLLDRVDSKEADYALADAIGFGVSKRLHPDLAAAFNVGPEMKVAWAFSPAADAGLMESAVVFFEKMKRNGTLARLQDRYFGHTSRMQPIDSETIIEKVNTMLPTLRPYFHEAQEITGIEWRLIAAIGYQESHWDALATSPTGVRGIMMLTEDTADRLKIRNRLDARDSIIGGAKYLAILHDTVPPRIPEPDRTWLALAAYNQGYGHLEDARILTQRQKLNADSWLDVRKAYALLRNAEHHETLKHGFARGDEAVSFVENVRNYYDILARLDSH
jgi:membrane-bound lytic murein transglycosylase F